MPWIEHSIKDDDEEVEDMSVKYYYMRGDGLTENPSDIAIPDYVDEEAAAKIREIIAREKKKKIKFEEVIDDDTWS